MTGFGFDREHLEEAGASRAGPRAAVTSGDNSKVLTARIARESHDMPQVVARVCDLRRAKSLRRLGLPTVPSVSWTTDQLLRGLIPAQSAWGRTASTGTLRLVEVMLPAEWAGRRLAEVVPAGIRIAAVTRGGTPSLKVRDIVGQEGDSLQLLVTKESEAALRHLFAGAGASVAHPGEGVGR